MKNWIKDAPTYNAMHVQIFTTGGTIDKVYFDAKSEYEVGESTVRDILEEANVTVSFEVERLFQKDSLDLTDADRDRIARRVREAETEQVLVTHGTDTMVLSARALQDDGDDAPDKTVVFTGSLHPARFQRSDAVFNVGFAMAAAQTLPHGVYLAMNGRIFTPGEARKNHEANRFEVT